MPDRRRDPARFEDGLSPKYRSCRHHPNSTRTVAPQPRRHRDVTHRFGLAARPRDRCSRHSDNDPGTDHPTRSTPDALATQLTFRLNRYLRFLMHRHYPQRDLQSAAAEYSVGCYSRTIQLCQYVLARDDESFEALVLLGLSLLAVNATEEGISSLEEAALIRPLDTPTQIELAIGYGANGRSALSRDLLMGIATGHAETSDQMLRIAVGFEALDQPRLAMEACRNAGALNPESAEVHFRMSYYARQCGHAASTIEALLRRAIDLEPRNVHYRVGLASLLIRLDQPSSALTILRSVVPAELDRVTCTSCLKRIANLYFDFGEVAIAKRCAERLQALVSAANPSSQMSNEGHSVLFFN